MLAPVFLVLVYWFGIRIMWPQFQKNVYKDPVYGFSIRYSEEAKPITDKDKIVLSGYIPVCDPDATLACFVFPSSTFPDSNFSSAGVGVAILKEFKTEETCLARRETERSDEGFRAINEAKFKVYSYGEGAAGHHSNGLNYRGFHDDTCYQLSTRLNTTVFENYEPGTITRFDMGQENKLLEKMDEMIASFSF